MARSIARIGDANSAGGVITSSPQSKVTANGQIIAVTGARGTGHPPNTGKHVSGAWICIGNSKVTIQGMPVVAAGDNDSCGHPRVGGDSQVTIA